MSAHVFCPFKKNAALVFSPLGVLYVPRVYLCPSQLSLPLEVGFRGRKVEVSVAPSFMTQCDPVDCSLPGSSVHGVFQVRILEWGATPFSRGSSRLRDRTRDSHTAGRFYHLSHQGSRGRKLASSSRKSHSALCSPSLLGAYHQLGQLIL